MTALMRYGSDQTLAARMFGATTGTLFEATPETQPDLLYALRDAGLISRPRPLVYDPDLAAKCVGASRVLDMGGALCVSAGVG